MNPDELAGIARYAGLDISQEDAKALGILLEEYSAEIRSLRNLTLPDDLAPVVSYALEPWS